MIYDRIKELREKAGISQSELARRLAVTRSSVNAWEMGISTPTTQYIVEMARIFKVTTDYLLDVQTEQMLTIDGLTLEEIGIIYSLLDYFRKNKENQ